MLGPSEGDGVQAGIAPLGIGADVEKCLDHGDVAVIGGLVERPDPGGAT